MNKSLVRTALLAILHLANEAKTESHRYQETTILVRGGGVAVAISAVEGKLTFVSAHYDCGTAVLYPSDQEFAAAVGAFEAVLRVMGEPDLSALQLESVAA